MAFWEQWGRYVPVAERRAKARREMDKLRKKGKDIQPVTLDGRTIARSTGSGVGQGHLGGDQFLRIDAAQQEEQFGPTVEPATYAVEHGGNVFAHVRPVRTAAVKSYLTWLGEQAMVAVGHDGHHLVGQFALEQFEHRADVPGTCVLDGGPGGGF